MRHRLFRIAAFTAGAALLSAAPPDAKSDEAQDALVVETILRLDDFDLAGSEKAQATVARYLESNWGRERYLDLIRRFELKSESPGLLRLALDAADTPAGSDAASLLVHLGGGGLLANALAGDDPDTAAKAAKAIGNTADPALLANLSAVVADDSRPAAVRAAALTAAYGTHPDKHPELLAEVKAGKLAEDLKQAASEILMLSRDPKVRRDAQAIFAPDEDKFPPVAELVKRAGNAQNGKVMFATKTCIVCHKAEGVGIVVGPDLSEIGDKLDKEALYLSIIEPSAGISMGFEGWEITLKDGTPLLGIIEESDENITVTMIGGAKRSIPKSEVASKTKLEQSLMYPGLHRLMTLDELADLIEYLSTLKKAPSGS